MIKRILKSILWYFSFNRVKEVVEEESEGFGDTFHKFTRIFVPFLPFCNRCKKRRKDWNEKLKYAKGE